MELHRALHPGCESRWDCTFRTDAPRLTSHGQRVLLVLCWIQHNSFLSELPRSQRPALPGSGARSCTRLFLGYPNGTPCRHGAG